MKYAIVKNQVIVNIIEAEEDFILHLINNFECDYGYIISSANASDNIGDIALTKLEFEQKQQLELSLKPIREKRDLLLDETDLKYCNAERWSKMTQEEQDAWSNYKQTLRELPDTVDINNPIFPPKPQF